MNGTPAKKSFSVEFGGGTEAAYKKTIYLCAECADYYQDGLRLKETSKGIWSTDKDRHKIPGDVPKTGAVCLVHLGEAEIG
jgi:hypothetical protein